MLNAALEGALDEVEYVEDPIFGLMVPTSVPDVPDDLLIPRSTWSDPDAFDRQARTLAGMFVENFATYADGVEEKVVKAGPQLEG
jgi:phosphoenolpyruvate carboxykinase (ATP)